MWPLHSCSKIFWPADSHLADYSLWCMPVQFRHRLLFGNFQTEWTAEIPQSWIRSVEHYCVVFLAVSWLDFQLLGGLVLLAYFTFTLQLARVQCYNFRRWFSLHYITSSIDNILLQFWQLVCSISFFSEVALSLFLSMHMRWIFWSRLRLAFCSLLVNLADDTENKKAALSEEN